jgi:uncharacterized protein (DUF427 family)
VTTPWSSKAITISRPNRSNATSCCRATPRRCSWKGEASYYTLFVDGNANPDAVWFYPAPKDAAAQIKGRVAFWKGVKVSD